jgi:long-chain acyl-CoA synthetase
MGMSVPVSLMETLDQAFPGTRIFQGYGLTETAGGIVCVPPADAEFRKSSMGKIMVPGCIVETQGPEGEALPAGEAGELAVKGKCLMLGYFNRPELNAQVFRNGFFLTGDLGYQDEEGFFYHLGRKDDVINVGGEKVYPSEIEQALYFNPSVKEACVLGVDDPKKGKSINEFVCPAPGQTLEKRELMNFLKDRLASYKIPQEFVFLDALPKTPVGKVAKDTLRKFVLGQTP